MSLFRVLRGSLAIAGGLIGAGIGLPGRVDAQGVTTTLIRGAVRMADGSAADGGRVVVRSDATGFAAEAEVRRGRFLVQGLEAGGPYTVTVRRIGTVAWRQDGILLTLGEPLELQVTLEPAAVVLDTKQDMPTARGVLSLVAAGGKLYALAGGADPATGSSTVEVYNPATGSWSLGPTLPRPRASACAAAVGGLVFMIGGRNGNNVYHEVDVLDPAAGTWSSVDDLVVARYGLACASDGAKVYALGGTSVLAPPHPGVTTGEAFDPTAP